MSTVVETSRISFLEIPRRYALSGWHYWVNIYIITLTFLKLLPRNFPPLAENLFIDIYREFYAYSGNIKEKPAVSKSQRKSLMFGGHCARYVQTQYGNYISLKLPYAVRSAAPDKQQKGLKWQVCDGRGMLQSNSRICFYKSTTSPANSRK